MKPFIRTALEKERNRLTELEAQLASPDSMSQRDRFVQLSKEYTQIQERVVCLDEYDTLEHEYQTMQDWLNDPDLADMAQEESIRLHEALANLEMRIQRLLIPKDLHDERPCYVEVRSGTGGDESALFAADLMRMYSRFADRMGWRVEVVSCSDSDLGGVKEAVLRIDNPAGVDDEGVGVYGWLQFESGGHRVQRVPVTEAQGRIHTSAATVAVLPEADPALAIELNPSELRIDTFRASGAGGQHINKTDSAVRVTHLPTGITAECQDGRSQHSNKAKALQVLAARLQEKDRSERAAKEAATRKGLVGSGDRSDRIRTYNFPQGRLTDHRINLTLYQLESILDGDLEAVIHALRLARGTELLADLEQRMGHLIA